MSFVPVGVWPAAIFFGLYSASFMHCVRWLLFEDEGWRLRTKINRWLMTTTLLVFFLSTAQFCGAAMITFSALNPNRPGPTISFSYYMALGILNSSVTQWTILMVIDSVMIYRCWTVFSKNPFIICFPVVLWCFCLTCDILFSYCFVENSFMLPLPDSALQACLSTSSLGWPPLAFFACNIVINMYTTSALVYQIWRAAKNNVRPNWLYRICRILTESGILYTLSSLFYLISWIPFSLYGMHLYVDPASALFVIPVGFQIALGVLMFMPGIAFNLVIIRIGEQRAKEEDASRDVSKVLMPSESINHPDLLPQGEMGKDNQERMDEGEVTEIDEMETGEIMEVDGTGSWRGSLEVLEELSKQQEEIDQRNFVHAYILRHTKNIA